MRTGLVVCLFCTAVSAGLESKTGYLGEPYLEWDLSWGGAPADLDGVQATAVFQHQDGLVLKSPMFYAAKEGVWKFRFTPLRIGQWQVRTEGPGSLGGQVGRVTVKAHPRGPVHGFIKAYGSKWGWSGTGEAFVPQLVMAKPPVTFWNQGQVDTEAIDAYVREFITEHGFTGFHLQGRAYWFGLERSHTMTSERKPLPPEERRLDERTFAVFEALILRTYQAGGMCHLWLWGSDNSGRNRSGPWGIGGHASPTARFLLRTIAARLGPLPGWSMGYGFDLDRWVHDPEGRWTQGPEVLPNWYQDFKETLGAWPHIIGARAHTCNFQDYPKHDHPPSTIFWHGDYAGYVNFRPAYGLYVETIDQVPGCLAFQEDRNRIRGGTRYAPKDYLDPYMVVRGLWHSTMAGGVANIWGNLSAEGNEGGSLPFNTGRIQGVPVRVKEQIKTYARFFFAERRFRTDLIRDNALTDFQHVYRLQPKPDAGNYNLCVCLRSQGTEPNHFVFYRENCGDILLDLSPMSGPQPAVAVDVRLPYREIVIGELTPCRQRWQAPYASDWAVAVGRFE